MNIKGEENQVLLCKDPVYDVVYYVNYKEDYYIYRLKDGKPELVVELPARRLFCRNGNLYFMLESYDRYEFEGMESGNILCYCPTTGEVTIISDKKAYTMCVYQDGIYYYVNTYAESNSKTKDCIGQDYYYYSFDEAKSTKLTGQMFTIYKWKDYFLGYQLQERADGSESYDMTGLILQKPGQSDAGITLTSEEVPRIYCFIKDSIYYMTKGSGITICNIKEKDKKEIPLCKEQSNVDFTMIGNKLYVNSLIQIDLDTGTQSIIGSQDIVPEAFDELYTDGEQLYGIGSKGMVRIQIIESTEEAIMLQNDDGTKYETGRYTYSVEPM